MMKLFNTLTQSLETFIPLNDTVRIYVCGITPYDTTHLGHAFTYVSFDTLMRYLEFNGYKVRYVQNVTDIDDDILRKAREVGLAWDELGRRETKRFLRDMDMLNVRRPVIYACATEEVPRIVEMVQTLVERGYAYISQSCVFYDVRKDPDFGGMAHAIGLHDYQSMLNVANERGNMPDDRRKKDPLDFVLWQAQAPGEPAWPSPWGPGRPGWHIECSSMAMHYLGEQLDIHGGGVDLTFPHHTCEIAQSERYSDKTPFVRYWMHTGMVYQDGEKMSKSLGNLTLISNLLKDYSPDAIRLTLENHHYRHPWECLPRDLQSATETIELFQHVRQLIGRNATGQDLALRNRFKTVMDDDLNTPEAIHLLKNAAETVVTSHDTDTGIELLHLTTVLGLCI
jgi:L-cysteine:1D-myo-inositol 2-amino-2-deoxy-alpha-D-glucopyranoside ligase